MATSSAAASGAPAEHDIELDTAALRVLAHPLRLSVLTLLRERGPSTATRIAGELGINPGAASYHLRRLASGGLIVAEAGRGTGRERWWKSAHRQSVHDPATTAPEQRETARAYTHAVAMAAADRVRRSAQELPLLPREWLDVSTYSDFLLYLTPSDVDRLTTEIAEVVARYRHPESRAAAGSSPVALQVQAFPLPGTVAPAPVAPAALPPAADVPGGSDA